MELAVSILSSAAVSAALSASLVWFFRSWIGERLKNAIKSEYDLKLEAYKNELSTASSREIEALKAQLQIATSTHQIQFATLHAKVAETVAGVYSRIVKLRRSVADYVKIMEASGGPTKAERRKVLGDKLGEFHDFYQPSKIYLPKNVIAKIDELEKLLFETASNFKWMVEMPESKWGQAISRRGRKQVAQLPMRSRQC